METVNEAIAKRKSIRSFADRKVEAVDRFDSGRIHYNHY